MPRAAYNPVHTVLQGYSGGPVVTPSGKFLGIVTDSGHLSRDPRLALLTGYVNGASALQFAAGYSLAPAN